MMTSHARCFAFFLLGPSAPLEGNGTHSGLQSTGTGSVWLLQGLCVCGHGGVHDPTGCAGRWGLAVAPERSPPSHSAAQDSVLGCGTPSVLLVPRPQNGARSEDLRCAK